MNTAALQAAAGATVAAAAIVHAGSLTAAGCLTALLAAAFSVALAVPFAVALGRLRFEGRAAVFALLVIASATSPALLGHASTSAPDLATRVGLGLPLAIWVVYLAARWLPPHLEDAAVLDGAGPLPVWVPLLLPAVATATAIVFLYGAFDPSGR